MDFSGTQDIFEGYSYNFMPTPLPQEFQEKILAAIEQLKDEHSIDEAKGFVLGALAMADTRRNQNHSRYSDEEITKISRSILDSAEDSPSGAACVLLALFILKYEIDQERCSSRLITKTLGNSSSKVAGTSGTLKDLENQGQVQSDLGAPSVVDGANEDAEPKKPTYVYWLTKKGEAEARRTAVKHALLKSHGIAP